MSFFLAQACEGQALPAILPKRAFSQQGFTENKGQIFDQFHKPNKSVKYFLRGNVMNVQLRSKGFSYDTYQMQDSGSKLLATNENQKRVEHSASRYYFHRVDVDLLGANPNPAILALNKSGNYETHYSPGNPDGIVVFNYQQIIYREIYPGIDLVFSSGNAGAGFEYDFVIKPGADASKIKLQYKGAGSLLKNNRIQINTVNCKLEEKIPQSFLQDSLKKKLKVNYKDHGNGLYSFAVPAYDKTKTLVIDPTPDLVWGTYGGAKNQDYATAIAQNPDGSIVVAGASNAFTIATAGAYQSVFGGADDAIIAKYTGGGKLLWRTYYGGISNDWFYGICVDKAGNIFSVGNTFSQSGIASPGSFQPVHGDAFHNTNTWDGMLVKFTQDGRRIWGTYYGGVGPDQLFAVKTDRAGNIVVAGETCSSSGMATAGSYQEQYANAGYIIPTSDGMLAMFDTDGNRIWGTYFGGAGADGFRSLDIDKNDFIYAGGSSNSQGLGTTGVYQPLLADTRHSNALVVGFSHDGQRRWATYFGGSVNVTVGNALACDREGNIILGGSTGEATGIATPNVHQPVYGGNSLDGFVAKFSPLGSLTWSTYYGGQGQEWVQGICTDAANNIIITGSTTSIQNITTPTAYQPGYSYSGILWSPFIAKLDKAGKRVWGTYYGDAPRYDFLGSGEAVMTDEAGNVFACGETGATKSIASCDAEQAAYADNQDMYIAMFSESVTAMTVKATIASANNSAVCPGTPVSFTAQIVNGGTNPVYQWQINGVNVGTNSSSFTSSSLNNADMVSCTVTSSSPCVTDKVAKSNSIAAIINPSVVPGIAISRQPDGPICKGTLVTYNATVTNEGSAPVYQWLVNNHNVGTNSPVFTTSSLSNGDLVVCTLTNPFSCNAVTTNSSNGISTIVTTATTASVNISANTTHVCASETVEFTAVATNAGSHPSYRWTVNGKTTGTLPVFSSRDLTSTDTVQCTIVPDNSECIVLGGITSNQLTIDIYPLPDFIIQPAKAIIKKGDSVQLVASGTNIGSLVWSPATDISNPSVYNPVVSPSSSQIYQLKVSSPMGCTLTKPVTVEVISDIRIPNVFSPNYDGRNDTWVIRGLELYPDCIVQVYNRWGQMVFYSKGYHKPWDGKYKNNPVGVSSFIYIVDLKNGSKPLSGTLTLIR